MRKPSFVFLIVVIAFGAHAHVGPKVVKRIEFSVSGSQIPRIGIDNLGLFIPTDEGFRWLCDEALIPFPGLNDIRFLPNESRYLVASRTGLYHADENACSFVKHEDVLAEHVVGRILPISESVVILGTQTLGRENDLFRSKDGGQSWTPVGLEFRGRIRSMIRSESNPRRLYVVHSEGMVSSEDGGTTFAPVQLNLNGQALPPVEVNLLGTDPIEPDIVYAVHAGFPKTILIRSENAGRQWRPLLELSDIPDSLIIDPITKNIMLASPLDGLLTSSDQGLSWTQIEKPKKNLWMGCLTQGPDNTIWACVQQDPDLLVVTSEDWGKTWTTRLSTDLNQVDAGFECPADSPSLMACAYTCDDVPLACQPVDMSRPMTGGQMANRSAAGGAAGQGSNDNQAHTSDVEDPTNGGCQQVPTPPFVILLLGPVLLYAIRQRNENW